jgi:hypothetical protein
MRAFMQEGWQRNNHICGSGSETHSSQKSAQTITDVVCWEIKADRIANVGSGHLQWWRHWNLPKADHYDLIPREAGVVALDCTTDVLPHAYDLIVCRWVLNHLSVKMAFDALDNFVLSGSKYLLMTHKPTPMKPQGNSVGKYWDSHGLRLPDPIMSNPDGEGWRFNLYDLTDIAQTLTMTTLTSPDKE